MLRILTFTALVWAISCVSACPEPAPRAFSDALAPSTMEARGAEVSVVRGAALRLATGHTEQWPGVQFKPSGKAWDLSGDASVSIVAKNVGDAAARVVVRIDDAETMVKHKRHLQQSAEIAPGDTATIDVVLKGRSPETGETPLFFAMRGTPISPQMGPGGGSDRGIDLKAVTRVTFTVVQPTRDHVIELSNLRVTPQTGGQAEAAKGELFPFVDRYGQYMLKDWPGKLHDEAEFVARRKAEEASLAATRDPADWNRYGGWLNGPQLKATGFFRVEKVDGKWWFIDPDGRLFFSHGVCCVRTFSPTPIEDRDTWFAEIPERGGDFASCFSRHGANRFYYVGRKPLCFDFSKANLIRKYGEAWADDFSDTAHRRLRAWGLNTIANWSDQTICQEGRTPYVVAVHFQRPAIEAETGHWKKMPDVFAPEFKASVVGAMEAQRGKNAGDPWLLGYFVDNELPWQSDITPAQVTLRAPATQPAKQAMLAFLKKKYGGVARLNQAWGTKHESWDALAATTTPPDPKRARADLLAFSRQTAEHYFKTVRDAVKSVAPNALYLGIRFSSSNQMVADAAAKYCDVVSYNLYRTADQLANWRPDTKADVPIVIGEWHFGALDRGLLHTGLRGVATQDDRAQAYRDYVGVVLDNPQFVGCHWFIYKDQPLTGRPADGENYQIGLTDVTDTPYPETIAATREMGEGMYRRRFGK